MGPALDHYRCVTCYFPRTRTTQVCDTVTFVPHKIPIPKVSLEDHLRQAVDDIVEILTKPPSTTSPTLQVGEPVRNAILEIADVLKRTDTFDNTLQKDAPLPRVQEKIQKIHPTALPRVPKTPQPTTETYLRQTTLPTKLKYVTNPTH